MTENIVRVREILANIEHYENKIKEAKAILEANNVHFYITYNKDKNTHGKLEGDPKTEPRLQILWDELREQAETTITIAEAQIARYNDQLTLKEDTKL